MQHRNWKNILQQASPSPEELLSELDIEDSSLISRQANQDFPLRVPAGFISKMSKNDPADPLFKQIWPSAEEEIDQTGFSKDPLNEVKRQATPGLLQVPVPFTVDTAFAGISPIPIRIHQGKICKRP